MLNRLIAVALLGCLAAGPLRADYEFEFAQGGTFGSAFTVNQGSTITLQVYLAQTGGGTSNTLVTNGLTDGGVALQYASNGPFNIVNRSNIVGDTAFTGPNNSTLVDNGPGPFGPTNTSTASLQVHNDLAVSPGATDPSGNPALLLGTFTFTGQSAGTGTTITALPSNVSNVDGMGNNLESFITGNTATINVVAVPEPGTLLLTTLLVTGMAGAGLRRLRRTAPTAS
jgi:hypothetical protein